MGCKRLVVIGGGAGGMSAAAKAARVDRELEIVVYEKGRFISFAACSAVSPASDSIFSAESKFPLWVSFIDSLHFLTADLDSGSTFSRTPSSVSISALIGLRISESFMAVATTSNIVNLLYVFLTCQQNHSTFDLLVLNIIPR